MLSKIRLTLYFLYLVLMTGTVGILICFFRPFNTDNAWLICRFLDKPLLWMMGLEFSISQREHLDSSRPCVFISNHQNNIDLLAGSLTLPHNTVSLGKTSIIFIPLFGLFYWLSGNILINRKNKRKAKESMEKVTDSIQNKGMSVWIMPEGTRSRGRGLMPFKTGAFRTAIDAGVPIVPICFNSYQKTINLNKLKSGTIACKVLEPIPTKDLSKADAREMANMCYQAMFKTIEELDRQFPAV